MKAFTTMTGIVVPVDRANIDTDQIIPAQFLKRIERTGYEDGLFYSWRFQSDGKTLNMDFEFNAPCYEGATILVVRENFGCGSSREHAPWALENYGIRCVLAPSFADIFYGNCFNNGMLPVVLSSETIEQLMSEVRETEGYELAVDLPSQTITKPEGTSIDFEIDPSLKARLINGWDQIGLTLRHEDKIAAFEAATGVVG